MHVVCGHVFGTCVYAWCVHMCTLHVYCGVHTCVWCMHICMVCAHVYSVCILWCVRMCIAHVHLCVHGGQSQHLVSTSLSALEFTFYFMVHCFSYEYSLYHVHI